MAVVVLGGSLVGHHDHLFAHQHREITRQNCHLHGVIIVDDIVSLHRTSHQLTQRHPLTAKEAVVIRLSCYFLNSNSSGAAR